MEIPRDGELLFSEFQLSIWGENYCELKSGDVCTTLTSSC